MFTGIVQGPGEIVSAIHEGGESRFRIKPGFSMPDIQDGESIAVNGACLSVESHEGEIFSAYASAETAARTTLGGLRRGAMVNLERALELGQRLGGHIMSGHVDCVARVSRLERIGRSIRCRLEFPQSFDQDVVAKGSVALDGISLTVNACGPGYLEVNVIPDTRKRTNMNQWRPGSKVNMETDIIGKYVSKITSAWLHGRGEKGGAGADLLARYGFL